MASGSYSPDREERTDGLLAPAVGISIAIAIFAVVTQALAANGAISLNVTQQLTMWLVAAGLIVLLWIVYMICRAYVTARAGKAETEQAQSAAAEANARRDEALAAQAAAAQKVKDTQEQLDQARQDAEQARNAAAKANARRDEALEAQAAAEQKVKDTQEQEAKVAHGPWKAGSQGEDGHAWVPPAELRRLDGSPVQVSTKAVFPNGCRLVPDSISAAQDDEETETDDTVARINRPQPEYRCRVVDLNPELNGRSHEAVVILGQKPSLPSWARYALVEFDDLMITPYMTDRSPIGIGYTLHAAGIKPAEGQKETA